MLLFVIACDLSRSEPSPERSLVIVSLDTVSAPHLALYGGRAKMPAVEALAGGAVVFEQAISHFPETGPSHWSILTGALPELHGNVAGQWDSRWTGPTLAERYAAGGRPTGAFIGGVTLQAASTGLQRGFDVYDDRVSLDPLDMKRPASEVTGAATTWMRAQTEPFFAFVHYFDAHAPYTPRDPRRYDPDYAGTYDGRVTSIGRHRERGEPIDPRDLEHVRALYHAEISELDEALVPLFAAIPDDAVVVVLSDHGESFGHEYLFNHRGALWEEILRVPLILRAPGLKPGRVAEQVGLVDVAPTVATLVGLPEIPGSGTDLTRVLAGQIKRPPQIFSVTDPWGDRPMLSVRQAPLKVIWERDTALAFKLDTDPGELNPVPLPAPLEGTREAYAEELARLKAYQVEKPLRADPGKADREHLEQLGYVVPAPPPGAPGPVGPPPGAPGGPPLPAGGAPPHGAAQPNPQAPPR